MDGKSDLTTLSEKRHKKTLICAHLSEHKNLYGAHSSMVTPIEGTDSKIVAALLLLVYEHNCWCFLASKGTYNFLCAVAIFVVVSHPSDKAIHGCSSDSNNVTAVNEALNEIYMEEEDYDRLRESIDLHDSFDQIGLAQKLEKHELLEMRRVAAYIYKKAGRWKQSIALSKKDNHYKDCMETCSQSGDHELSEELLIYFIEQGKKECFAACLFVCYDMIRPDVALELAWMNNIIDFALPYLLQFIREYTGKVNELIKDKIEAQNELKAKEKEEKELVAQQNMYAQLLPALPAPPGMGGYAPPPMPPMGGMGMPPMPPFGMPQMGPSY